MTEPDQVDLALGSYARDCGARAYEITRTAHTSAGSGCRYDRRPDSTAWPSTGYGAPASPCFSTSAFRRTSSATSPDTRAIEVTMTIYVHASMGEKRRALGKLDGHLTNPRP